MQLPKTPLYVTKKALYMKSVLLSTAEYLVCLATVQYKHKVLV